MIKLTSTAKLPYEIIRGSYQERLNKAKNYNKEFFEKIKPEIKANNIEMGSFYKVLESILQKRIKYFIRNSNGEKFKGCTFLALNTENFMEVDRYNIFFPLNEENKISLKDMNVLMHELFHFFCEIANPKHSSRTIKVYETNLKEISEPFYNKYLYTKETWDLKKSILPKFLDLLTNSDKIDFLQNCRYRLIEELNAYNEGDKYEKMIEKEYYNSTFSNKNVEQKSELYHFKEKIELIEYFLEKSLTQIRGISR